MDCHLMSASARAAAPLVKDLVDWMARERAKLSRHNDVAKATTCSRALMTLDASLKTAGYA